MARVPTRVRVTIAVTVQVAAIGVALPLSLWERDWVQASWVAACLAWVFGWATMTRLWLNAVDRERERDQAEGLTTFALVIKDRFRHRSLS